MYFTPGENLSLSVSAAQYKSLHWFFIGTAMGGAWNRLTPGEYSLEDFNQTAVALNATARHEGYYVVLASSSDQVEPICHSLDSCTGRVAVLHAVARGEQLS